MQKHIHDNYNTSFSMLNAFNNSSTSYRNQEEYAVFVNASFSSRPLNGTSFASL
ncbi:MAG TPA: hypothetical protein PL048_01190 [Leptospiraceae bacterium]|nr:hypothetical protein [Leptospiraceae bacterium]HMY70131.1 hypothetical protein [Leptospiraceae bacterium]HMZ57356.1 hypothetical protein [Leptospiraceae bacterium]HNF13190.1 hypothetical protein [Leptospiraceae bacterium]HNF23903.1 hypothetical protein [Leptospiraceae bacterium]